VFRYSRDYNNWRRGVKGAGRLSACNPDDI
jgi:hypothetical protein